MALLSISAAARAVKKNRTTLHRKLSSGELSATTGPDGSKCIDTSELERVFGPLHATGDTVTQPATPPAPPPQASELALVELLKNQLARAAERERDHERAFNERERAFNERERWLKEQLESEQQARRELETRLLAPPPAQPDPEPQAQSEPPQTGAFRRFWGKWVW